MIPNLQKQSLIRVCIKILLLLKTKSTRPNFFQSKTGGLITLKSSPKVCHFSLQFSISIGPLGHFLAIIKWTWGVFSQNVQFAPSTIWHKRELSSKTLSSTVGLTEITSLSINNATESHKETLRLVYGNASDTGKRHAVKRCS